MILPHKKHIRGEAYPWVILINGLFTDQEAWNKAITELDGFNVLTYDGRGQGNAPKLVETYELDQQVADLNELVDHLGIEQFALVGLSNGGRVALKYGSLYSEKLWSLVACDTYGSVTPLLKLKIDSWLKAHEIGGAGHRFDIATPWVWGEALIKSNPELLDFYRNKSLEADEENILSLIKGALSGGVEIGDISCPTLLLAGEEDVLTPIHEHKKIAKEIEGARFESVPGGHASLIEYPETIGNVVLPFLRSTHELG